MYWEDRTAHGVLGSVNLGGARRLSARGMHGVPTRIRRTPLRQLFEGVRQGLEGVDLSFKARRSETSSVLPFVRAHVEYDRISDATKYSRPMNRQRNSAVNVPPSSSEKLLKDQLRPSAHAPEFTSERSLDETSVVALIAVHDRTSEAVEAINNLRRAFDRSAYTLCDVIVFIDEPEELRNETIEVLKTLAPPPTITSHGDGNEFWARSFERLLRAGLSTGARFLLHLNTDVVLTTSPVALFDTMCADPSVGAVAATLDGDVRLTGYRRTRPWFPFFRSVAPGDTAAYLPASCVAIRADAIRDIAISLDSLRDYRHGFADLELSCQLRDGGFRLMTTPEVVGSVVHAKYFRRVPNFDRFGGSFVRYVRECPTAPCLADTQRIGRRLFGRWWFVLLRFYLPVLVHYGRYRLHRATKARRT